MYFGESERAFRVKPNSYFDAEQSRSDDVEGGYGVMSMQLAYLGITSRSGW